MYDKRFSGHQSFPLRKGWLHKYYKIVDKGVDDVSKLEVEDLAVKWGVGKNMVDAIKYWADAIGIGNPEKNKLSTGASEEMLSSWDIYWTLNQNDSYMVHRSTLWLTHWLLCRDTSVITSYRYFFSFYSGLTVSKDSLYAAMEESFERRNLFPSLTKKNDSISYLTLDAEASMKKDINVFFQMYSSRKNTKKKDQEDCLLAMFTELELLKELGGQKDTWVCELDERVSLSDDVFSFCLLDYITRNYTDTTSNTIPLNDLIYGEGSPGRVFRMSEKEIENRLEVMKKSKTFEGKLLFDNSRGSRSIIIKDQTLVELKAVRGLLDKVYKKHVK
ncbi:DUF4007 family protein [Vibrio sp. PID17_43]|uniref:DUF4007 family protein n=1 Tax=Vibrio sp. PID17_43 TaxID=1583451 RepID=UPI000BFFBA84|nr:DUF4007 family protein [Vibrio sp. PID17_43]PHJ42773.1 hypothetical protein AK965_05185 [Vibrio sp. PID17_43]